MNLISNRHFFFSSAYMFKKKKELLAFLAHFSKLLTIALNGNVKIKKCLESPRHI